MSNRTLRVAVIPLPDTGEVSIQQYKGGGVIESVFIAPEQASIVAEMIRKAGEDLMEGVASNG